MAAAVSVRPVPSVGVLAAPTRPWYPLSFTFSTPIAIATSYAPLATEYAAFRSASEAVAQKFSTCVTGLSCSCSGRASAMPLMPDMAVPSQYASTSSLVMPVDANVASAASTRRSSVPLFHCSPKFVQPIPTMATRSLIPCEPMALLLVPRSADRARFPEVVVNLVRGEQLAERHLDAVAHLQRGRVDVGE